MEEEVKHPLCILLNSDLRIYELDLHNLTIQERRVKKEGANAGEEYWVTLSYHGDIQGVVNKLLKMSIRGVNVTTLEDIIKSHKQCKTDMVQALQKYVEAVRKV